MSLSFWSRMSMACRTSPLNLLKSAMLRAAEVAVFPTPAAIEGTRRAVPAVFRARPSVAHDRYGSLTYICKIQLIHIKNYLIFNTKLCTNTINNANGILQSILELKKWSRCAKRSFYNFVIGGAIFQANYIKRAFSPNIMWKAPKDVLAPNGL